LAFTGVSAAAYVGHRVEIEEDVIRPGPSARRERSADPGHATERGRSDASYRIPLGRCREWFPAGQAAPVPGRCWRW